jgi:hypothetical protein
MPKKSKEPIKKRETKTDKKRRRKIAKLDKERAEKIKKERQAFNDKIKKIIPARVGAISRANITEVVAPSGSRGGEGSYKPRRTSQQIRREKEAEARRILGIKKGEKEIEQLEEPVQRARAVSYNQTVRTPIGGFTGLREGYGVQSNPNKTLEEKLDNLTSKFSNLEKREKESVDTPQIREVQTRRRPLIEEVQDKSKELLQNRIRRGVQETQERNRQRQIDRQTLQERDRIESNIRETQQKDLRDAIRKEEIRREKERKEKKKEEITEFTQRRLSNIDERLRREEEKKEKEDKRVQDIRDELDRQLKAEEKKKVIVKPIETTDEDDFEDEQEIIKIQEQNKLVDDIMGGKKERTITFEPQEELRRKDKSNRTNPPSSRKIQTIEEVSKQIIQDLDEEPLLKREKEKRIEEIKEEIKEEKLDEEFQDVREVEPIEIRSSGRVNIIDEEPEDINIQNEPPQPSIDNRELLIKEQIRKDKLIAQQNALEQARGRDAKIRQREEQEKRQISKDIVESIISGAEDKIEDKEIKELSKTFTQGFIRTPLARGKLRELQTTARKSGQGRPTNTRVQEGVDIFERLDEKEKEKAKKESKIKKENIEILDKLREEKKQLINELYNDYKIDGSVFPMNARDLNNKTKAGTNRLYQTFLVNVIREIDINRNENFRILRDEIIGKMDRVNQLNNEINILEQKIR